MDKENLDIIKRVQKIHSPRAEYLTALQAEVLAKSGGESILFFGIDSHLDLYRKIAKSGKLYIDEIINNDANNQYIVDLISEDTAMTARSSLSP